MPEDHGNQGTFETKGTPTVYCNQAVTSLSYNDVRVYLMEQSPSELVLNPTGDLIVEKPPISESKYCLVLSPEFANALAKSLTEAVAKYEAVFGSLRSQPTQEGIHAALSKMKPSDTR
jgi:hypothetical protein